MTEEYAIKVEKLERQLDQATQTRDFWIGVAKQIERERDDLYYAWVDQKAEALHNYFKYSPYKRIADILASELEYWE